MWLGNILSFSVKSLMTISALLATAAIVYTQADLLAANGKIAFVSDRDGDPEIYLMNSDGTQHRRLTEDPGLDLFPTWSPDGRKIAFLSQIGAGTFALVLMDDNGAGKVILTPVKFTTQPAPLYQRWAMSWSPDGQKIAFQESGEIFVIDIEKGDRVNLTNDPASDFMPAWSPDGTKIAFVSNRNSTYCSRLHTMNADGSNVVQLPCSPYAWGDFFPDWSPRGNEIVYVAWSEEDIPVIFLIKPDGTDRRVFDYATGCQGWCSQWRSYPRWSPDGRKIVFSMAHYSSLNDTEIFMKNIGAESPVQQVTNTPGNNLHPSWQPLPRRHDVYMGDDQPSR